MPPSVSCSTRPEFEVDFEAAGVHERRRVSAVSVSNNPFGQNALLYADSLTGGELGFYTAKPLKPLGVARLAIDLLRGKVRENADVMIMHPAQVHLHFPKLHSKANCVMDGELRAVGAGRCVAIASRRTQGFGQQGLAAQIDEAERRGVAP